MGVYSGPEGPVLCRVVMGAPRIALLCETTAWTAHGVRGAFRDRSTNGFVTRFQIHLKASVEVGYPRSVRA